MKKSTLDAWYHASAVKKICRVSGQSATKRPQHFRQSQGHFAVANSWVSSPGSLILASGPSHSYPLDFQKFCRNPVRGQGRHGHQELQGRNAVRIFNESKRVLPLRFRRPRRRPGRRPPAQAGGQAGTDTKNHKGETRVDFSNNLTAFALWVPPACRPAGLLKEFVFFKNPLRIQGRQAGGSKMAKTAALRV